MRLSTRQASWATALAAFVFVAASAQCGSNEIGRGASVLEHQANARRDGVIVDPAITLETAPMMHLDQTFDAVVDGTVRGQPLFIDGLGAKKDMILVATGKNQVYALDALTGATLWMNKVANEVPLSKLPCGGFDPYGITGTPVVDLKSRTMFLDAMTTPDGGLTIRHLIFGISIDDGSLIHGWPVDANVAVAGAAGTAFLSKNQGQRGALVIMGNAVYVPFGGLAGDCGTYHGWVVEIQMNDPTKTKAWATPGMGGGIWATGGLASDGVRVYAATGNTIGVTQWSGGEAIVALPAGVAFTGAPDDYWAPMNWKMLDNADNDLGGSSPIVFDLPGSTPSQLILALGKDGHAYMMDRNHLGGIAPPVAEVAVASSIIGGANLYTTDQGVFVALRGMCLNGGGNLGGVSIVAGTPPTMKAAWCANQHGTGSPITTTSDGIHDVIVWATGATVDNRLHGFDGRTGAVVFDGGGPGDLMVYTQEWTTPIAAKGRIYVGSSGRVYAFTAAKPGIPEAGLESGDL